MLDMYGNLPTIKTYASHTQTTRSSMGKIEPWWSICDLRKMNIIFQIYIKLIEVAEQQCLSEFYQDSWAQLINFGTWDKILIIAIINFFIHNLLEGQFCNILQQFWNWWQVSICAQNWQEPADLEIYLNSPVPGRFFLW